MGTPPLTVANDLDIAWPRLAVGPLEADPPSQIDADAELPLAVAIQRLSAVAKFAETAARQRRLENIRTSFVEALAPTAPAWI
jgi:hypothetical protein